jgi:hypothetical protein
LNRPILESYIGYHSSHFTEFRAFPHCSAEKFEATGTILMTPVPLIFARRPNADRRYRSSPQRRSAAL